MKQKNISSRPFVTLAGAAAAASFAFGCISVVPYEPNAGLVTSRGFPEVKRTCEEVMNRALNPHVGAVDVTEDFIHYAWTESYLGPFYTVVNTPHENRIYFANVARVEVYENNYVFIWGPEDKRVDKVLFANPEDVKLFVDCLMSLKSARKQG